jgi:hypothetical protein
MLTTHALTHPIPGCSAVPCVQTPVQELCIEDCPLLPEAVLPLLPLTGSDGKPLTLQQLEAGDWWEVLPQPYRDVWRRHAGRAGVEKWLYTPHFDDLQVGLCSVDRVGVVWWLGFVCLL